MTNKIQYILMSLALLCSCVKTEKLEINDQSVVTFNTSQSRATQTAWETGDKIGIFMVRESAPGVWEAIVDDAFNKCYSTNGDGVFTPATANDAIKAPKDGNAVNFVAYYPYDADLPQTTPCLYGLDMTLQDDAKTNFLVSRNLQGVKVNKTVLTLDFIKPLAKVVINVRTSMTAELLKGMTVAIDGVKYDKADYALLSTTNDLANVQSSRAETMARVSADGKLAEATLLCAPNALSDDARFVFTLAGGRELTYKLTEQVNLASGVRYTYNIRLKDVNETNFIDVLPAEVLDFKIEGGTRMLSILSDASWSIKSAPDWVDCSPRNGVGGAQPVEVGLTFPVNYHGQERTGNIVFEQQGGTQVSVAVSQVSFVNPNPTANFNFAQLAQTIPDVLTYSARDIDPRMLIWTYYSANQRSVYLRMEPTDWISFKYPGRRDYLQPGDDAVFTVANNNSSQSREVVVRLESYDKEPIKFYKIIQQGATEYLEVSQNRFSARGKGDKFDFVVTSRYDDWTLEGVPSWVNVSKGGVSSNKTPVTITCADNQGAARSANITIRSGLLTQTLEVKQNAKRVQAYPFKLYYSAIVHAFAGADFKFVGASQGRDNYANTAWITVRPGDGISIEEVKSYGPYGFVVDPPWSTQFRSTAVAGQSMVLNYYGQQTTIAHIDVSISYNGWTYIRRANIYNLPVPAGLTDEDKLIYTIKMTDVVSDEIFKYDVTYEIK